MSNLQKAAKSVRAVRHGDPAMPNPADHLPVNRSFVERHIGQLVGIFQIDRLAPQDHVEARSLATGNMTGLIAVADGGKLSETAFNAWTIASHLFDLEGCPESNRLDFTLGALSRRIWGESGRSAAKRKRLVEALEELMRTQVVVVGVDPYTLEPNEGAVWKLNLLEATGARGDWGKIMEAARIGDRDALTQLASLSSRGEDADANTWSMVLPKWLADSVRRKHGVILDYEIQRALRGSAKRIWVQLANHPWERRTVPAEADVAELLAALDAMTDATLFEVLPQPEEDIVELERLTIPLTSEVYEAFGLRHANRKRDLEAACESLLATDRTYLRAEVVPQTGKKRRYELRLVRAAGQLRQDRLRLGMLERSRKKPVKAAA